MSIHILSKLDLEKPDLFIRDKIQDARLQWQQDGLKGEKSAFVILALSEKIALSQPDSTLMHLARKLCFMYLLKEVRENQIFLDSIDLDLPSKGGNRIRWDVGINYFSAQGDKRWWQDHRIPGGMAFSMNSVGHMAKSGRLSKAMREFEKSMSITSEGWRHPSINSLDEALVYAMRTIANASVAISGKATELLSLESSETLKAEKCPVNLPKDLDNKNCREYAGFYHTDITIPSEYFLSDIERPYSISPQQLDFTYLFDNSLDNPDYINMGEGRRVCTDEGLEVLSNLTEADRIIKRGRAKGIIVTDSQ